MVSYVGFVFAGKRRRHCGGCGGGRVASSEASEEAPHSGGSGEGSENEPRCRT